MCPWEVLASRPILHRPPWLSIWEEDVRLPSGLVIEGYLRAETREYAMVYAMCDDGSVPLVRQYKHGLGRPCYDLPAGYLEDGEPPLLAAQRELREETGLTAPHWQLLGHLLLDTNRGPSRAHIYLAQDARRTDEQALDPSEALEVSYHTVAALREMVRQGELDSLPAVAGIMLALDWLRAP